MEHVALKRMKQMQKQPNVWFAMYTLGISGYRCLFFIPV